MRECSHRKNPRTWGQVTTRNKFVNTAEVAIRREMYFVDDMDDVA